MTAAKDIASALKAGSLIIGTHAVIKASKRGTVKEIVHATNIPENLLADLQHASSVGGLELKSFGEDSVRLGQVCGKPFKILSIGIKK